LPERAPRNCVSLHGPRWIRIDSLSPTDILPSDMKIEIEQEVDGRWIAEVTDLSGVLAYGQTRADAIAKVKALALRVLADRLEHGESIPDLADVFQVAA